MSERKSRVDYFLQKKNKTHQSFETTNHRACNIISTYFIWFFTCTHTAVVCGCNDGNATNVPVAGVGDFGINRGREPGEWKKKARKTKIATPRWYTYTHGVGDGGVGHDGVYIGYNTHSAYTGSTTPHVVPYIIQNVARLGNWANIAPVGSYVWLGESLFTLRFPFTSLRILYHLFPRVGEGGYVLYIHKIK